ncbi:MAG: outer membrane lipoprotein carrier protein LolA [Lentisphaeraceae bacterium]|nr:outer membrane lipoprotein carrier protein LolA [Lentisphaeraceae bacterium]
MKKLLIVSSVFLFLLNFASADEQALRSISALKEVGKIAVLRTNFEQVRKIDALTRPLISKGSMILSKKDGLLWSMKTPFATDLLINKEKMVQLSDEGEKSVVKAEDQPVLYNLSEIFMALFSGNLEAILKNFELEKVTKTDDKWQVVFNPRGLILGKVMKRVELSGGKLLENVQIFESNGDSTSITFSKTTYDLPNTLTAEEQQQLQLLSKE